MGVPITYGTENCFNPTNTYYTSVTKLDDTHFVVAYRDEGGSEYCCIRVGTISGTTITYGTEVCTNVETTHTSIATLDSTHFVVVMANGTDNKGSAYIGSVSGTTITLGAVNNFNTLSPVDLEVATLDSTHFVVCFNDILRGDKSMAIVGVVSGITITSYGTAIEFFDGQDVLSVISISKLDSTHFVAVYYKEPNDYGYARVGSVSGTTITPGTENGFASAAIHSVSTTAMDATHFLIAYSRASKGYARIGLVSGTTITSYGAESEFNNIESAYMATDALDDNHFIISFANDSTYHGYSIMGHITGTDIESYIEKAIFNSVETRHMSIASISDETFVVTYSDWGTAYYGCARHGSIDIFIPQINIV